MTPVAVCITMPHDGFPGMRGTAQRVVRRCLMS
jgi:hypothetical protein